MYRGSTISKSYASSLAYIVVFISHSGDVQCAGNFFGKPVTTQRALNSYRIVLKSCILLNLLERL